MAPPSLRLASRIQNLARSAERHAPPSAAAVVQPALDNPLNAVAATNHPEPFIEIDNRRVIMVALAGIEADRDRTRRGDGRQVPSRLGSLLSWCSDLMDHYLDLSNSPMGCCARPTESKKCVGAFDPVLALIARRAQRDHARIEHRLWSETRGNQGPLQLIPLVSLEEFRSLRTFRGFASL